jgi:hypothetical protein
MRRLLYLSFTFVTRTKDWLSRRFTKAGLMILAGLVSSAVVGLDTHQTVAYQAFTFLLALMGISILWSVIFRARFSARRKLPQFATVQDPFPYGILIQNHTPNPQANLTVVEGPADAIPSLEEFLQVHEPDDEARNPFDRAVGYHRWMRLIRRKQGILSREQPVPPVPPHGELEITAQMVPFRRGYLPLPSLIIACPDPMGLFKSVVRIPAQQTVLVLPKRYPLPPVRLPGSRRYQPGGMTLASSVGESEEFMSVRDYRPGDPIRRIHWKSWARVGRPIVKEYQDEFFVRHALVLDTFQPTEHSEIFEAAVSIAASFACTVRTQDSLLDLMFVGPKAYCFTAGRGLAHTHNLLEILAAVRTCRDKPFDALPPLVMEHAGQLSGCICILLSWDGARRRFISRLRALGIPVLVLVVTDGHSSQPLDPGPMDDAPGDFKCIELHKIEEGLGTL